MSLTVSPTLQNVYIPIMAFIVAVTGLPELQVVQGLPNRTSMPEPGFITVQTINRRSMRTPVDLLDETTNPPTTAAIEQDVELTVQIDCYGPSAMDWADMLSATLRDEYGCAQIAALAAAQSPPFELQPLYADDARMMPLVDGEDQYEERWSLDAHFQFNPVTTIPQDYAAVLDLTLINVDVRYPPA